LTCKYGAWRRAAVLLLRVELRCLVTPSNRAACCSLNDARPYRLRQQSELLPSATLALIGARGPPSKTFFM